MRPSPVYVLVKTSRNACEYQHPKDKTKSGSGLDKTKSGSGLRFLRFIGSLTHRASTAGNQTKDYLTSNGTRTYDAENQMTSATDSSNHTSAYSYDGDGHRVKRNISWTETWQVYGLGGELIAEYAQNGSASSPQKEYGYRNGQLLVNRDHHNRVGQSANSQRQSAECGTDDSASPSHYGVAHGD